MKKQIATGLVLFSMGLSNLSLAGDGDKYAVKLADFNTKKAEYSPTYYNGELLYVSNNRVTSFINRYNKIDGEKMYDIVYNGEDKIVIALLDKINSKYNEGPLTVINEGKTVFFTRNNYLNKKKVKSKEGKINLQILYVELQENGTWSDPKSVPFNSSDYNVGHPTFSSDEKSMFFSSDMPGSMGGADIYKVVYNNGVWFKPENLGVAVNSSNAELFPYLSNKNELYFSSNREGGQGGLDIYKSKYEGKGFIKSENVGAPLNSMKDDFGLIFTNNSGGNDLGYFSSNREGGKGSDDIYEWESLLKPLFIAGKLFKEIDNSPIANAIINFTDTEGITSQVMTDAEGYYKVPIIRGEDYAYEVESPLVYKSVGAFSGKLDNSQTEIKKDISVEEWPFLYGEVKDELGKPLDGVTYIIKKDGKAVYTSKTKTDGVVKYTLPSNVKEGDILNYTIEYKKDNYLASNQKVSQKLDNAGKNSITSGSSLTLIENKVGVDIAKIINIEPIYYEYNKAEITSVASIELDKIVAFLKENPGVFIELASHTDARGSASYNLKLSDKRAKSAAKYVQSKIDNPKRIYGKGYGESSLKNTCTDKAECSEEQHAENRRTEFTIVK